MGVVSAHATYSAGLLFHRPFDRLTQGGVVGVDVFFVISGFVMGRIIARPPSASDFFWERATRIAPIYYLMSAPWIVAAVIAGKPLLDPAISTFLFCLPGTGSGLATLFLKVGWTLCFEMLFYSTLTLILASARPRIAVPALLAAFIAALIAFMATGAPIVAFVGNPMVLEFLTGILIARIQPRPALAVGLSFVGAAVIAYALAYTWLCHIGLGVVGDGLWIFRVPVASVRVVIFGSLAVILVVGVLKLEPWAQGKIQRGLAYLGDASYSLYLVHPGVIAALAWAWPWFGAPGWLFTPVALVLPVPVSVASYRWIEKPLLAALRPPRRVLATA